MTTINKEKMLVLKEELKRLASEIKVTKLSFKKEQRKNTFLDVCKKEWEIFAKIQSLRFHFRHKLIAYSLLRGVNYESIEKNCREDNKPNWVYIEGVKNEIAS